MTNLILEDNDVNTFALLQQFHYFIMSNSTFIWWCAYLANTKKVIVPAKWFIIILKGIMLKGVGIQFIWKSTLILVGMTLFFIGLSVKKYKIRLE